MSEDVDAGGWCRAYDVRGERCGRLIDQIGALGKAYGPPSSPMDGDGTIWAGAADRLCRLLGIEVTLTEGGPPTSDWHQSKVDVRYFLVRKSRACVPRIPAPVGAGNEIAQCWPAMRAPRVSSAVMISG